jgi:hypothetical protein
MFQFLCAVLKYLEIMNNVNRWLTNSYICLVGLVARQLLRLFAPVYDTGSVKTR